MPETARHSPSSSDPASDEDRLLDRLERAGERERLLRSLLLEARDELVRERMASGRRGSGDAGEAPSWTEYVDLKARLRSCLEERLPAGSFVLVVSRGDDDLLAADVDSRVWHFPSTGDGRYAGHHPADSESAIAEIEKLRRRGAEFLVFPATALWWLEHYDELTDRLDRQYGRMVDDPETCVVYDLRAGLESGALVTEPRRCARPDSDPRRPFAAVTIISRNYLAQARVLAKTFLEHEPESRFYVLVVDGLPDGVEFGADATLLDLEQLDVPNLYDMCFKYGVVEFSTAVKPYVLACLFDIYGEEEVAYFDPDIMVMRRLDELRQAMDEGDIVLTPHIMQPLPIDGKRPTEQDIMISGAYNLGFIALKRSPQSEDFLHWWQERLEDGCRIDVSNGLFTDQKWIDLAPSLFPSTFILRDPAYNVAFWNLHERVIARHDEQFLVNGRAAGFFHLSGFSPVEPDKLSKHQNRIDIPADSSLEALLTLYASLLAENGFDEASGWEYGFERFDNGIRVHPLLRQMYLNLGPEERGRFGNPFSTDAAGSFLAWATTPAEKGSLSPFLRAVYAARYDLASIFPDVAGKDRDAFLQWARRWGSVEMKFEPELVRDGPARTLGDDGGEQRSASPSRRSYAATGGSQPASSYEGLVQSIRSVAQVMLPAGSTVLVISKGDPRLLDLGGSEGWHFPQISDGVYGGFHPPNSDVAISHLEALRRQGAGYLLIPRTALWWLEYYPELRRHLETNYRLVVENDDCCRIYSLRSARGRGRGGSFVARWLRRLRGAGSRERSASPGGAW